MKPILTAVLLLLTVSSVLSQNNLYMPINIKRAYDFGTRSYDGKPGSEYWQNHADYKINAELDTSSGILTGSAEITYHNESPDELSTIVVRLYQDIFRKGNPRDFGINQGDINDGTEIHKVMIDTLIIDDTRYDRDGTLMVISLENGEKIKPGGSINLTIDWSFKMPLHTHVRMGRYFKQSYFVGYWYPQISVYDDIDGWDRFSYMGWSEFYNDFNNYDVNITMPQDFIMCATGVLQNPEEVLSEKTLARYNEALVSDSVIKLVTEDDLQNGGITKSGKQTWHYTAAGIPDFAFGTSNEYVWDMSSMLVDSDAANRITTGALYHKHQTAYFAHAVDIVKHGIRYFSNKLPGIHYPYPQFTVFNGHHGMEFPMLTNIGSNNSKNFVTTTITHELAHTYFPFYMGVNETKYAWMEEGWAVMLTYDLDTEIDSTLGIRRSDHFYLGYVGVDTDTPLMTTTHHLAGLSHGVNAYYKAARAYFVLQNYLGEDEFKKALQEFIWRWKGKHPIPYDFFFTFEDVTGEDLSWIWEPWFFEFGYPDLGIKDVYADGDELTVTVEKIGNMPIPIHIIVTFEDNERLVKKVDAGVWKGGKTEAVVEINTAKLARKIELDSLTLPDKNPQNNFYTILRNSN